MTIRIDLRTNPLHKGDKVRIALRNDRIFEMSCFVASEEGGDT